MRQRDARKQCASERDTDASREEPFKQHFVQLKMRRFHNHFICLNSPKCSTCSERFPGIQLRLSTTECMRCHRDKHTLKLCSKLATREIVAIYLKAIKNLIDTKQLKFVHKSDAQYTRPTPNMPCITLVICTNGVADESRRT